MSVLVVTSVICVDKYFIVMLGTKHALYARWYVPDALLWGFKFKRKSFVTSFIMTSWIGMDKKCNNQVSS